MADREAPLLAPLLATAPALLVLAWWSLDAGGYFPSDWLPGTVIVLARWMAPS